MIFILIRIFPFLVPILYLILLKATFILNGNIFWPIVATLLVNFLYFLFLFLKKKRWESLLFILHSWIVTVTGFFYILILSSETFINSFIIIWSLLYFLYLESVFHYFYETKKVLLLDLKNIIAYINLVAIFFLTAFLINLHIFINFSIWLVFALVAVATFVLMICQLQVNKIKWRKSLLYALLMSMMMLEILISVIFLSVSFYVSAMVLTVLYYLLSSILVLNAKENLTKSAVWQYLAFTVVVILIISLTSQWL